MTTKPFKPSKRFIALMACLTGLTALGIDAVLPIFPEMISYYQLPVAEHNRIQQVVFAYMLGFSLFQLFFGILADTFGRKPLLLFGIGVYLLAAASVVFLRDFEHVLWARFIQGAGLAAPRVLTMTVVRDVSSGRAMSRIMSFITMIFLIIPAVAPMIGQLIVLVAPWQAVFVLLAVLGAVLLCWVQRDLTETLAPENRRTLSFGQIGRAIAEFLSSRFSWVYLLMISMTFGGLMMYIGMAEQILQKDVYQLGAYFPFAFATIVLGMASASITNARLVMRLGLHSMLRIGLIIMVISDAVFLLATLQGDGFIPLGLFLLLFVTRFFGFGLMMPNLNTLAIADYHHLAGTASALIGMITSVTGVLLAQAVSSFFDGTLFVISYGFMACSVVLVMAFVYLNYLNYSTKSAGS
ncbi:MAG: MFS transporter [Gammaproteobacteria bacterium]|nr:MAG: MFS transporter [Gammaproteobacteria bacterium]